jgi:hypothetical protein
LAQPAKLEAFPAFCISWSNANFVVVHRPTHKHTLQCFPFRVVQSPLLLLDFKRIVWPTTTAPTINKKESQNLFVVFIFIQIRYAVSPDFMHFIFLIE